MSHAVGSIATNVNHSLKHRSGNEQLIHHNTLRYRAYGELWRNELKDAVTSLTQAVVNKAAT